MEDLSIQILIIPTELGLCRTVNFCDKENFLRSKVDEGRGVKYIFSIEDDIVPENQTQPYMTTSPELGVDVAIFHGDLKKSLRARGNSSILLMIHSPFELPTKGNQKFYMTGMEYDTFFVTPQLYSIDDTMIGMEPHE